jgi:hypothetical protein
MINRVAILTEETRGKPLIDKDGNITGWINPYYVPVLSQFPWADQVSYQDGTMYVVYAKENARTKKHGLVLWRHSVGIYAIFGSQSLTKDFATRNLVAYCNQTTHSWRWYYASGTDTSLPVGSRIVTNRLMQFATQPPKTISPGQPWVQGTFTITSITPTVGATCGPIDMFSVCVNAIDPTDQPGEITLSTAQMVMSGGEGVTSGGNEVTIG